MSAETEITRLQAARNAIRDKLVELGLAASTAKLDALATAVDGIENRGAVTATFDGLTASVYTIPDGYHAVAAKFRESGLDDKLREHSGRLLEPRLCGDGHRRHDRGYDIHRKLYSP